ncbi:hypothetical protein MFORT_30569 [Mycolicibacterium fortuitum subsp. fortuitum DSM 46621 = ATCC 6841 = JCM 6387]|uniref:Uncharacterized protein n=1 Tax=Mycolicibacterium fortuitum subsp. fortuitum DSM 46621 = ATCC 6841 = JCM 6387 TaxID=1214102 RepID=K0UCA1_MYCFO|nr:hypothetical protein MFORT_30569 [Mycolicibacterium fortuitum subsp. fortuitum DSM 46621 = ATCC 6841 = JCM 6387]
MSGLPQAATGMTMMKLTSTIQCSLTDFPIMTTTRRLTMAITITGSLSLMMQDNRAPLRMIRLSRL